MLRKTVFISYAHEDIEVARRLFDDLKHAGFAPWLDEKSLLPGQRWKVAIKQAIRNSRYFLALLSKNSVSRKGYVQKELREALELLDMFPESDIFLIPVRIEECLPAHEKLSDLHWVDMFPSWDNGLEKILNSILEDDSALNNEASQESRSELATNSLASQIDAARILPQIQQEFAELKLERKQQIDGLLQDAMRLIRKRFEYTNPDPNLQRLMADFRIKMDLIPKATLMKYTGADSAEQRDWHYSEIFLRRGIIAYFENDPAKAHEMLKTAQKLLHFSEESEKMTYDQRFATAFTNFYLALIEKNYGDIRRAQDYIEKSYIVWGRNVDTELLTPTTRAEILSYLPGGIQKAREAISEIIQRLVTLKKGGRALAKHENVCAIRAFLILGNTYYIEGEWEQALLHYQIALNEDVEKYYSYYTYHSIAQAKHKLGRELEANDMLEKAYKHLLDSSHLYTKVALDTRILLNALAYLCTRDNKPAEAAKYKQSIFELWLKIHSFEYFELRLFSIEQKRQVSKDEFWRELSSMM